MLRFVCIVRVVACVGLLILALRIPAVAIPIEEYDVHAGGVTGVKIEGPATVRFTKINPIRYDAQIKVNVTFQAAPTPPAALTPQGTSSIQAASSKTYASLTKELNDKVAPAITLAQADVEPLSVAVDNAFGSPDPIGAINNSAPFGTAKTAFVGLRDTSLPEIARVESDMASASGTPAEKTALVALIAMQRSTILTLLVTYPYILRGFADADIQRDRTITCSALLGGSSTSVVTLTLTNRASPADVQTDDVTVVCLARVAVSAGFIFSSLPQQSFTAQPTNGALPSPAPAATIQQSTSSSIRAIPVAFVHVSPSESCGEQCFFLSFGAGVNTGAANAGTTVDFAAGVTYSLARYVFITTGANLGQVNELAPGYNIGDPIPSGMQVPTVTRTKTGFFLGITFGGR